MEIILLERVENLGQMGDLVTVKPGYARNFLLPKGKAIRAILHPEVSTEVTVNIARSADEAAEQQRLGRAIISDVAEREREEAAAAAQQAAERVAAQDDEDDADTTNSASDASADASADEAPAEDQEATEA